MYQHISKILEDSKSSLHQIFIPTGNATVDRLLGGGIGAGELINFVAAGVTGCNELMLSLATDMAVKYNMPTAVIDLGGDPKYFASLVCAHVESVPKRDFWHSVSSGKDIVGIATMEKVKGSPIYLCCDYQMSLSAILRAITELSTQKGVKTFFITSPISSMPNLSHDEITLSLRKLCKELGVSILLRSIPNYAVETNLDTNPYYAFCASFRVCVDEGMSQENSDVIINVQRPDIDGIRVDTEGRSLENTLIATVYKSPRSGLQKEYIRMGENVLEFM